MQLFTCVYVLLTSPVTPTFRFIAVLFLYPE